MPQHYARTMTRSVIMIKHYIIIHYRLDTLLHILFPTRETADHRYFIMTNMEKFRFTYRKNFIQNTRHQRIDLRIGDIVGVRSIDILRHITILTIHEQPAAMPQGLHQRHKIYEVFPAQRHKLRQLLLAHTRFTVYAESFGRIPLHIFNFTDYHIDARRTPDLFHQIKIGPIPRIQAYMHPTHRHIRIITDR